MVLHWRRIIRHNGDYFGKRRLVIRRCLANIHAVVESSSRERIRAGGIVLFLGWIMLPMSMLAAVIAGFSYLTKPSFKEQMLTVRADHRIIRHALESFYAQHGRYPSNSDGMSALLPYVPATNTEERLRLVDPWGNPYVYRTTSDGKVCTVMSLGADGLPGGGERNGDVSFSVTKNTVTAEPG